MRVEAKWTGHAAYKSVDVMARGVEKTNVNHSLDSLNQTFVNRSRQSEFLFGDIGSKGYYPTVVDLQTS
jgi:hypothetical protein